ncbi:MAG: glycosyltransferase [Gemmatimonadales bacterium]|jgi:glycosyltransferase involved in cell wall biosynthesis|nr:glycosyltransferase [Gemmatimonadales bacterium]
MHEHAPRVSVIVPTYNRAAFLAECLESLLGQTLPPWQVIVVNDGATDQTDEVVAPFRERITYLRTSGQLGKPGAANLGLAHVTGDYVWLFDDDDVALPEALARFTAALEADPGAGFAFSAWWYARSRPDGRIGDIISPSYRPRLESEGQLIPLFDRNYIGGAALFARTRSYHEVGVYDVSLIRSQDYEMSLRMARRFRGVEVPGGPTFLYRQHDGARGASRDRFTVDLQSRKWLDYDQRIFRRLLRELSLEELLPPGTPPETGRRQAQLQRFSVAASKLMVDESVQELRLLARIGGTEPLTPAERRITRATATRDPWYGYRSVYDHDRIARALHDLAGSSPVIRELRREVVKGLVQAVYWPDARTMRERLRVSASRLQRLLSPRRTDRTVPLTPIPGRSALPRA